MTIIQELLSNSGNFRNKIIQNIQATYKEDGVVIKGFTKEQHVIWCEVSKKSRYPIALFPSKEHRDKALYAIRHTPGQHLILDYNDFFMAESITDEEAKHIMQTKFRNFKLMNHFNAQLFYIREQLLESDAFVSLNTFFKSAVVEKKVFYIETPEYFARLWAKTIFVPQMILNYKISRRQFFLNLINRNNEVFHNTNNPRSSQ